MPRIQPYYAVKANPDPVMLKLLASMGVNFDCASRVRLETECDRIQSLNVEDVNSRVRLKPFYHWVSHQNELSTPTRPKPPATFSTRKQEMSS